MQRLAFKLLDVLTGKRAVTVAAVSVFGLFILPAITFKSIVSFGMYAYTVSLWWMRKQGKIGSNAKVLGTAAGGGLAGLALLSGSLDLSQLVIPSGMLSYWAWKDIKRKPAVAVEIPNTSPPPRMQQANVYETVFRNGVYQVKK